MKIISVNTEGTKSLHDVSFNLDEPIDPEVAKLIKTGNLTVRAEGLIVQVVSRSEEQVTMNTVRVVNDALESAAMVKEHNDREAAAKRERLLSAVRHNTGLSLG